MLQISVSHYVTSICFLFETIRGVQICEGQLISLGAAIATDGSFLCKGTI